jgi:quercetin dioxygenase-like cupin family protein
MGSKDNQIDYVTDLEDFLNHIGPEFTQDDIQVNVGERVKGARQSLGLSIRELSERTGMDASIIEEIEKGSIIPPLGEVISLAKGLRKNLGYLIWGNEDQPYTIVRRGERKMASRHGNGMSKHYGYDYFSLAPHKAGRHMDPFFITLKPSQTTEDFMTHEGQEFIYVLDGEVEVQLGEEIHILKRGETVYYDSTTPHLVKCKGSEEARIVAVFYSET